jgi:hypothetical protein
MSNPLSASQIYPDLNVERESMANEMDSQSAISDVESHNIHTLFRWIDKYDGSRTKLNEFITNTDAAFELATPEQHSILLAFARKQLTGRAKIMVSIKVTPTWNSLKNILKDYFSPTQSIDELILESQTLKQLPHESITDFTLRLDILDNAFVNAIKYEYEEDTSSHSGMFKIKDSICLRAFTAGVLPRFRSLLTVKDPKSYLQASLFCQRVENENNIFNNREQLTEKVKMCTFCNKKGHIATNCYAKLNQRTDPNANENAFEKRDANKKGIYFASNQSSRKHFEILICKYCKNKGHSIEECRKLKFRKEQENYKNNKNRESNNKHLNSKASEDVTTGPRSVNIIEVVRM